MKLLEVIDMKWRKHPTQKGVLVRHGVGPEIEEREKRFKAQQAAAKAKAKREERADDKRREKKAVDYNIDYRKLGAMIEQAVGNAVPDGDPIDQFGPYFRRLGIEYDWVKYLDRAVKMSPMLKHHKTYNGYLKDMWDSYLEQDPEWNNGENPWG